MITPEQKRAWQSTQRPGKILESRNEGLLADALRDTLAQALKAEYEIERRNPFSCFPARTWTDADWQAEAERVLLNGHD